MNNTCLNEIGYEIVPLEFQLLIKPLTEEEAQASEDGLIIPKDVKAEQARNFAVAKVLSIGDKAFVDQNQGRKCQAGDYIIYNKLRRESIYLVDYRDPSKKHQLFFINDDEIRAIVSQEYAFYQAANI